MIWYLLRWKPQLSTNKTKFKSKHIFRLNKRSSNIFSINSRAFQIKLSWNNKTDFLSAYCVSLFLRTKSRFIDISWKIRVFKLTIELAEFWVHKHESSIIYRAQRHQNYYLWRNFRLYVISLNWFNSVIEIPLMIHSYFVHGFECLIYVNVD